MKRFAVRIGRFFWSWRFLKIVLWIATIIILFYAEEDWRGARAWAATKAKWEARGHSFDLNKYFAPPIPDGQNLAAIPLFRLERAGNGKDSYLDDAALRKTVEAGWNDSTAPIPNGWIWGERPDVEKIRASISSAYAKTFEHAPPSDDPLAQLEALDPFLVEIREASAHRPLCRFDYDETQPMPAARALGLVTMSIRLSRALTFHAILALNEQRPDIALADYEAASKLGAASGQDPSLVGGLVQIGVSAISLGAIYDGLALHAWSDADLAELDRQLAATDYLAVYQFSMGAEGAISPANLDWLKRHPTDMRLFLTGMEKDFWQPKNRFLLPIVEFYSFLDEHLREGYWLWPRGWFDLNKVSDVDTILDERAVIDARTRLVYPNLETALGARMERIHNSFAGYLPSNVIWVDLAAPLGNQPIKFAYAQTRINEARIACALERYWLAHHQYPASLDLLVPTYLAEVPHDVMTGQPYHYAAQPDGTFRLYSVGWNLTDEGGVQSFMHDSHDRPGHPSLDLEHGDWPWPDLKKEPSR